MLAQASQATDDANFRCQSNIEAKQQEATLKVTQDKKE